MPTTTTVYTNFGLGGRLAGKGYDDLWPVIVAEKKVLLDIKDPTHISFMKKFEENGFDEELEVRPRKARKAKRMATISAHFTLP